MAVGDGSSADACHGTRLAGGSRVLLIGLAATKFAPLFMSGLHDAGWEVGVLQRPPNNSTRAWHSGSPPLIRFSRSVWKRDDKVDALIGAVSSWRPALVIPDFRTSSKLMISAVRKLERASAPLAPAKQAALDILRCSLPRRREHWDRVNDKLKLMAELSGVDGVEAPWHQQLSDPQGLLRGTAASKDRLRALERRLPLVVKTNSDGNGKGVQLCRSRDALTSALKQAAERGEGVLLEQLIDGTHAEFAGSALDGQLLSGFSYLDVVSMGEVGAAVLLRTTNLPAATRQVAAAVAALGYTGCLQVDFRVDRSGRVFFVDPNMRITLTHGEPAEVLGLDLNPLEALLARLKLGAAPPARGARAVQPVRHSVHLSSVGPGTTPNVLSYCADTFVHIPWAFASTYEAAFSAGAARFDARTCTVRFAADPPGVVLRQRCPLCPGRCAPLEPNGVAAYNAQRLSHMCARSLAWASARRTCAPAEARVAHAPPQFVVTTEGGRSEPLKLCGGPSMAPRAAAGRAGGAGRPPASDRWNVSLLYDADAPTAEPLPQASRPSRELAAIVSARHLL